MTFAPIDNFDQQSYRSVCPVTHLPKQGPDLGKQAHEIDEFILRGPEIVFDDGRGDVSLGYFDVRPDVIRQAAADHLGMIHRDAFDEVVEGYREASEALGAAKLRIEELEERFAAVSLANAELLVQAEAAEAEVEAVYEEIYEDSTEGDA